MCGIVGIFNYSGRKAPKIKKPILELMRDSMVHRGPDGKGLWIASDKNTGFGHRRLSIVELSEAASQPMISNDKNIIVTFNGEIYNHRDLREEITKNTKIKWQTKGSDTEVILRAYMLWGINCVSKFRGMFSFRFTTREMIACIWLEIVSGLNLFIITMTGVGLFLGLK